jgi:hypothetical protein
MCTGSEAVIGQPLAKAAGSSSRKMHWPYQDINRSCCVVRSLLILNVDLPSGLYYVHCYKIV